HDPEQAPELRHVMGMTAVARVPSVARVLLMARVLRLISMTQVIVVARMSVVARMPVVVHVIVVGVVAGLIGVFALSLCDRLSALGPVSLIRVHNLPTRPPGDMFERGAPPLRDPKQLSTSRRTVIEGAAVTDHRRAIRSSGHAALDPPEGGIMR